MGKYKININRHCKLNIVFIKTARGKDFILFHNLNINPEYVEISYLPGEMNYLRFANIKGGH